MAIAMVARFVAVCDRCGSAARIGGCEAQWEDRQAAVADLCGPVLGWIADPKTQICAACVAVAVCQAHGHDWGSWQVMPGELEPEPAGQGVVRACRNCGRDEVTEVDQLGRPA